MRELHEDRPTTVFLQDANPLLSKPDDLVRIVCGIRERFPRVHRITAYARSHTLARRNVVDLRRIRQAGLDRLHVGMESGCDSVLKLVNKGVTRNEQIEGGRRAKAAGFELSEYVMPGLGGRQYTEAHADDTASAIAAISPDFIRLRTTGVVPGTLLFEMTARGEFTPLQEAEGVVEIRRFLSGLRGIGGSRVVSDHVLNVLMDLRGDLPADLDWMISVCDSFLTMPKREQQKFILARRVGWIVALAEFKDPEVQAESERMMSEIESQGVDVEKVFAELRSKTL